MNELQIFHYGSNDLRTLQRDGEPWFVLKDVCQVLDLGSPHKVAERLDEDERNQIPVTDSLGRLQDTTIISESGLYAVILRSDKPEAKPFRKWVTSQVLPSIRKHGRYIAGQEGLPPDQLMEKALLVAQRTLEEQSARLSALQVENRKLLAALSWGPPANLWSPSDLSYMLAYALAQGREDYITVLYLGYYAALAPSECFILETKKAAQAVKSKKLTLPNQRIIPLNKLLIQRLRFHLPDGAGSRLLLRDDQSLYKAVSAFGDFLARHWPLASSGLWISHCCNGAAEPSQVSLQNTLTKAPLPGNTTPSKMDEQEGGR